MAFNIIIGRDESDKKKFGEKATIYLGKQYVKMGQTTSLSNKILLDVARTHVILVSGKRGAGKCLHGDTLITLTDGSQIPIKELESNNDKILSLNNKLKIEESNKEGFFIRNVDTLLKIKLRSGKEIKLTPEHPLLTIKSWQEAQNLRVGDRIATPRVLPCFGKREMPKHEIKLLAYLIAEGCCDKRIISFSNSDKKIIDEFRDSLKKLDPSLQLMEDKENSYRISSPQWKTKILESNHSRNEKGQFTKENKNIYKKRSIRKLLEREAIFGLFSKERFLSQNILQLKKENLAIFLSRLFSCDGSIYKTGYYWESSYCSSSKSLAKQVHHLLLRFGILSKIRKKKIKRDYKLFYSYEIVLNTPNTLKFIKEIGFFGEKEEKQRKFIEETKLKIENPNVDTIPKEIWEIYIPKNWAEIGRQLGYKHPKAMRERIHYSPSRQTLLQISKIEQYNLLYLLATSDIFWDEIVSMEILDGDFKVYDICIPGNHNFIANDIIVHNSYSLGVIAEEMSNLPENIAKNLAVLIFDTMGIFWTMKFKNDKEEPLLREWGLEPQILDINMFTPKGYFKKYKEAGIPVKYEFTIKPSELNAADWCNVFDIHLTGSMGVLLERIIADLEGKSYSINKIIDLIKKDKKSEKKVKNALENRFVSANSWGLFSEEGTEIKNLIKAGQVSVLDLSCYTNTAGSWSIKSLVIGLIARKLLVERISIRKQEEISSIREQSIFFEETEKEKMPLVWLLLDEAHEFLPREGKTPATDALVQLLREGRQPGISLVLATQQPGEIHKDVITQSDIVLSHRITAKKDITALNDIMQSYLVGDIQKYLNLLPSLKGSAILLDDNCERIYPIRVRPRFTWHGGEAPVALKKKKELMF